MRKHRVHSAAQRKGRVCGLIFFVLVVVVFYGWQRAPKNSYWGRIPAGTYRLGSPESQTGSLPREVHTVGFKMQRTEVTVGQFVRFLNGTRPEPSYDSPQIEYCGQRYHSRVHANYPVAFVSYEEATAYAQWVSEKRRMNVRLPSVDEWEIAARGGVEGIRYPWGWADPNGRAHFDAEAVARVARYSPNAFGLYDMAGNVAEWCLAAPESQTAYALGGSWAERDPDFLRVFHRVPFPKEYRDADVGFRVIVSRP